MQHNVYYEKVGQYEFSLEKWNKIVEAAAEMNENCYPFMVRKIVESWEFRTDLDVWFVTSTPNEIAGMIANTYESSPQFFDQKMGW